MTCPVCGRPYEHRVENEYGGVPKVRDDMEACVQTLPRSRGTGTGPTKVLFVHDPGSGDRGVVGDFVAGVREVL